MRFGSLVFLSAALLAPREAAAGAEDDPSAVIEKLLKDGQDLWEGRQFPAASQMLEEALRRSEALGDSRLQARSLDLLGSVADSAGELALGNERHQRALDLIQKAGDRKLEAKIHERMGRSFYSRADYPRARECYLQAQAILRELGDRGGDASLTEALGWIHLKQGAFAEAREHFERALEIATAAGRHPVQGYVLRSLGLLGRERGDYRAALQRFQESLAIWKELRNSIEERNLILEIGVTYAMNGSPTDAIAWYARALEMAEKAGDLDQQAGALFTMGRAHHLNGDAVRALDCLARSLAIRERCQDFDKQAWCRGFMGDVYSRTGDLDEALAQYRKALELWEKVGAKRPLGSLLVDLGNACIQKGLADEARDYFERALRSGEEIGLPYRTLALTGLARVHGGRGEGDAALPLVDQAVDLAIKCGMPDLERYGLVVRGRLQRQLGQPQAALRSFRESLEIIEMLRRQSIPEDAVKTGFLEDKQAVYEEALDLSLELGLVADALLIAERARARAFIDLLSGRELSARPPAAELLEEIRRLEESIRRSRRVGGAADKASREESSRGLSESNARLEKLRTENREVLSLVSVPPLTLDVLQDEARRRRATLVEYFVGAKHISIWVVGPDGGIHAARSSMGRGDLERLIRALRQDMNLHLEKSDPTPGLRRLHELLIEPIEAWLPREEDSLVVIVPHGELFLVAFAALLDRDGRYFLERHKLSVAPSAGVLEYTRKQKSRLANAGPPNVLGVGNPRMPSPKADAGPLSPLPGAEDEVKALARLFPSDRLTLLTGEQAAERIVRSLLPGETVIHFATHAIINEDPLASLIALSPEEGGGPDADGLLTAREIFGLNLHADLVVLSACNTAVGRISGDGVIGLSRAFLHAGAASVMVSLWRVADLAARAQMEDFYRALDESRGDKAGALRKAQLLLLERLRRGEVLAPGGRPLRPHPIYWAPFVLLGEPN